MRNLTGMIDSHPAAGSFSKDALAACIEACFECAQVCTTCADACLAEDKVENLRQCIRTDLDCADICAATGRVLSRLTKPDTAIIRAQVEALRQAVKSCGNECEKHAEMHEHCRICMEACRHCEESCRMLLQEVGDAVLA